MPTRQELLFDRIVAGVLFVSTVLSLTLYSQTGFFSNPAPMWLGLIWAVVIIVPLAWRRVYPVTVLLIVSATFIVGGVLRVPELMMANVALFFAIFTVGSWLEDRTRARIIRILVMTGMLIYLVIGLFQMTTDPQLLNKQAGPGALSPLVALLLVQILTNILYFGGAYVVGNISYTSRARERHLREMTEELDRERARTAAQAVELERLRIARELHDVVAHHVSMMGVQAGAARISLAQDPEITRGALSQIESSARSAIDELHLLLGTLRDAEPAPAALENSTLGVEGLPALARESTATGLPTRFSIVDDSFPVPVMIGFTCFRIAQEALTNARKHGGPAATADMRLRYLDDGIEIEISNTGAMVRSSSRGGLGLTGMRERVHACGGRLELGPVPRGGFLVRAFLPLSP